MIPAIVVSVDKALNEHRTVESENPERFWQLCHEIAVMADYKDLKIIVELLDFLSGILINFPPTVWSSEPTQLRAKTLSQSASGDLRISVGWETLASSHPPPPIPYDCQFWNTTALFRPAKITPKSAFIHDEIARIGQNRPNICILFPIKNAIRDGGTCTAYTVDTVYTVYIVQSASHCLNSSIHAYIHC